MSVQYTDSELISFHVRYISQLILYQVMIFIQIVLIVATAIKFRDFRQKIKTKQLTEDELQASNRLKHLFFAVLFTGTEVFVLVEWYGIADFLYDFAAWTNYCDVAAILCNLSILTYLLALFLFYIYRLHATFRGSGIGFSSFSVKTLSVITLSVYFVMVILVFLFQKGAVKHTPFAWSMKKADYKPIVICEGEFSIGIDPALRWTLQAIVSVGTMFYGYIFYKKLFDLVKFMKAQGSKTDVTLNKLVKKQATLVMVSTASTVIMWSLTNVLHYFGSFFQVLIYLDISINCLCLFLMFAWNDPLYTKLCKPCSVLDSFCCSSLTESDSDVKQMEKEIESHHSNEVDTSNKLHFHSYAVETTLTTQTSIPNDSKAEDTKSKSKSINIEIP